MHWSRVWCTVLTVASFTKVSCQQQQPSRLPQQPQPQQQPPQEQQPVSNDSAVQSFAQLSPGDQSELVKNVKAATDGLQVALQGISSHDTAKVLKGVGDVLVELPRGFRYAGVAFSLAASAFTLVSGAGSAAKADPVLAALGKLSQTLADDMAQIQRQLDGVNDKLDGIIGNVDRVLSEISDIPSRVVAEMQLTAVSVMKDKFANVHSHATLFAHGNLTRSQMLSKCKDFAVASLLSELETILKDERGLFNAKFERLDRANGAAQAQLLGFYVAVVPLVTNCNALEYSMESLREDWTRVHALIQTVYDRASWLLSTTDRVIHVKEKFAPFSTLFDVNGYQQVADYQLALSFRAYSIAPPHGACFQISPDKSHLASFKLEARQKVPDSSVFCVKAVETDDATQRVVYAERDDNSAATKVAVTGATGVTGTSVGTSVAIIQLETPGEFDPLDKRGWTKNAVMFFSPKAGHWKRLPTLTLVSDFVILQAATSKVSLDELTRSCQALGAGYDRDGDGHSKDYKGAPWTIFCLRYERRTIREIDAATGPVLTDVQFVEMEAAKAWTAVCPAGLARDKHAVSIPSKVRKGWLTGTSTTSAYAVCLKWEPVVAGSAPSRFVQRVWLDDAAEMRLKPKMVRNEGDTPLSLPAPPLSTGDLANFDL